MSRVSVTIKGFKGNINGIFLSNTTCTSTSSALAIDTGSRLDGFSIYPRWAVVACRKCYCIW